MMHSYNRTSSIFLDNSAIYYVPFDGMAELWFEISQTGCLGLKVHSTIIHEWPSTQNVCPSQT